MKSTVVEKRETASETNSETASATAAVIDELEVALNGGNAHASFADAIKDVRHDLLGVIPDGLPYSIWQLVEHIRITQWDILEFSRNADHKSPDWPEGYWPGETAPGHAKEWKQSIDRIAADRKTFVSMLKKAGGSIYDPFSWGDGQSLFREALLIADHTSYHTGEIVVLRRLLKDWKQ
jgi:hypothetical protein